MKLQYRVEHSDSVIGGEDIHYKPIGDTIVWCCDSMKEEFGEAIGFGSFDGWTENYVGLRDNFEGSWHMESKIDYCPFCGESIELEEMDHYKRVPIKKKRMETYTEYREQIIK